MPLKIFFIVMVSMDSAIWLNFECNFLIVQNVVYHSKSETVTHEVIIMPWKSLESSKEYHNYIPT